MHKCAKDRLTLLIENIHFNAKIIIISIQMYIFYLWTCPKYYGNGYPQVIGTRVPGYKISTHPSPTKDTFFHQASNWQLPFLNQWKGKNGRRNYFMTNFQENNLLGLG